jgi:hypothetical protein
LVERLHEPRFDSRWIGAIAKDHSQAAKQVEMCSYSPRAEELEKRGEDGRDGYL